MTWADQARATIQRVDAGLPPDVMLKDRTKAIDDAYPFGSRECFPYKAWLKERRAYLCRFGFKPKSAPHESPMERMMRRNHRPES